MEKKILIIGILIVVFLMISGCISKEGSNISDEKSSINNKSEGVSTCEDNTTGGGICKIENVNESKNNEKNENVVNASVNTSVNATVNTSVNATVNATLSINITNKTTSVANVTKNITNETTEHVPAQIIKDISVKEAYDMIQKNLENPNFIILDIRTPEEFNSGHIKGAINIDYYAPDFVEQLKSLDKNKTYLIYCRTGHRSGNAKSIFKQLGFREVENMVGGINRWKEEGYFVE